MRICYICQGCMYITGFSDGCCDGLRVRTKKLIIILFCDKPLIIKKNLGIKMFKKKSQILNIFHFTIGCIHAECRFHATKSYYMI